MSKPTVTAMVTAYARAHHTRWDTPKIFDDPIAGELLTAEQHAACQTGLASLLPRYDPAAAARQPGLSEAVAMVVRQYAPVALSRARYTEDALNRAVERGTRQYVLLGAGLDSYPYRRPAAHREVTVLELDHPATQGEKLARLAQLGWRIPDRVHHLPVDFAEQELGRVLAESPYDPAGPGFFSWLGVTYYLTRAAIQETLRAIATIARPGTAVVFDYLDRIALEPGQATPRIQVMLEITRLAGEPVITGFDPATLAAELAPLGFELAENLSPARIQHRYFADRTDGYQADQQTWFATAVVT